MIEASPLVDLVFEVLPGAGACGIEDLVRLVPSLGSSPIHTRLATEESDGRESVRLPALVTMDAVSLDFDGPEFSGVPAVLIAPTDAGSTSGATVDEPAVLAEDACDGAVSSTLEVRFPDGSTANSWPAQFPNGGTGVSLVTWTATDRAGNQNSATMRVEVANEQLLDADIILQGAFAGSSTRPIRIVGPSFAEIHAVPMSGVHGSVTGIAVPIRTAYDCLEAKDLTHSLTTAVPATVVDRRYHATFLLRQGDSNDDDSVDIYDFSLFAADRGLAPDHASRSNFNADLAVNNADFGFISTTFFQIGDACTNNAQGRRPITRVSVKDLRRQGLGHLAAADLNRDGWVDLRDVQQFMQGNGMSPLPGNEESTSGR
jgi:hypothetical protein